MQGREKRYIEGINVALSRNEQKRCVTIILLGQDRPAIINKSLNLNPNLIDFCFGARNVRVIFSNNRWAYLQDWLDPNKKFQYKVISFSGPEGTALSIVLTKDALL